MNRNYKIGMALFAGFFLINVSAAEAQSGNYSEKSPIKQGGQERVQNTGDLAQVPVKQGNQAQGQNNVVLEKAPIKPGGETGNLKALVGTVNRTARTEGIVVKLPSDSAVKKTDTGKKFEAPKLPPMQGGAKEPAGQPSPSI